jgi:hypothetical protein
LEELLRSLANSGYLSVHPTRHSKAPPLPDQISGIEIMEKLLGIEVPEELKALYHFHLDRIGTYLFINPAFEAYRYIIESAIDDVRAGGCIPMFLDVGVCYFGLDITGADAQPAVYYFDHDGRRNAPDWAAASSLRRLVQLLAAAREDWDPWSDPEYLLGVDPNVASLARAPPPWDAREPWQVRD